MKPYNHERWELIRIQPKGEWKITKKIFLRGSSTLLDKQTERRKRKINSEREREGGGGGGGEREREREREREIERERERKRGRDNEKETEMTIDKARVHNNMFKIRG